jgi:glucokinase
MTEGREAVGIDAGGTKIVAVRSDARGAVLARTTAPTPVEDAEAAVEAMIACGREVATVDVAAVGAGAAGLIELGTGVLRAGANVAWRDMPLRDRLREAFELPVTVDNDCTAAAFGEWKLGAMAGRSHGLYLGVGTGIGGGLLVDGRIYRGVNGFAGEVGHLIVDMDGEQCGCGNRGCWETVASGTTVLRDARRAVTRHAHSALVELSGGDPERVTGRMVTDAARDGDAAATGILAEVGWRLGRGIASLVHVFDPELVVVGGGLADAGDLLLEPARAASKAATEAGRPEVPIVAAALGPDGAAIGAALMALEDAA